MSSPIAKQRKSSVDNALIATHQHLSHSRRVETLAREFAVRIAKLTGEPSGHGVRVLDVGCGDMTLADAVTRQLPGVEFRCVDVHPFPTELARTDSRWQRYIHFDGRSLPFSAQSFDIVMFSDVLHHVPPALLTPLLDSAGRVGRFVVVKDHFEYGWWSRQWLRAMDCVGNLGYGVSVPERYFDRGNFQRQCSDARLNIDVVDVGLQLYAHLPVVRSLLSREWQFMAVCSRNAPT